MKSLQPTPVSARQLHILISQLLIELLSKAAVTYATSASPTVSKPSGTPTKAVLFSKQSLQAVVAWASAAFAPTVRSVV